MGDIGAVRIVGEMDTLADRISSQLEPLVGQPLSVVRRAADLQGFHFGQMRPHPRGGTYGAYILHVQCAWRLEHRGRVYTGDSDLWERSSDVDNDDLGWTYEQGNLRDERLASLLRTDASTRGRPTVERVEGTVLGDAILTLSGGYRLVIWPNGSTLESWRLLGHAVAEHFVIVGGALESPEP